MLLPTEVFLQPSIDWFAISPFTILLAAGVFSMLIETFAPRSARRPLQLALVFGALLASFVLGVMLLGTETLTAGEAVAVDGPGVILQIIIALVALIGAAGLAENKVDPSGDAFAARASAIPGSADERAFTSAGWYSTEIWTLFLFAVGGMQLFVVANDLLTMFIALEVMSLPLYLMAGMARRRRLLSQEAALKYFVLGAYSSAFFLFGAALVYGATAGINFDDIAFAIPARPQTATLLVTGIILIMVGMLFKVGSAPFHQWTPDVYQGAPTTLTAFMAAGVKVAAFGAMMRLLYSAFGSVIWDWRPILWSITLITMFVGVFAALVQTDVKRMLAYSSVAHAGFVLVGILAGTNAGIVSVIFYLAAYCDTHCKENVLHTENDVVMYYSYKQFYANTSNDFCATAMSLKQATFAVMFIPVPSFITFLCEAMLKLMKHGEKFILNEYKVDHVSEMTLLNICMRENIIDSFSILPERDYPLCFDPGSYGQFFGGTNNG
ncbi:MAG: NADH-quinone oxidoreductase subunit N, partial [Candidatus Nanopelagicales bacterium]